MAKRQFNSHADRRLIQHFQRVQAKKEANWDYDQSKRERKKTKPRYQIGRSRFRIEMLESCDVAVACRSRRELAEVFYAITKAKDKIYTIEINEERVWAEYGPLVYVSLYKYPDWASMLPIAMWGSELEYFIDNGYSVREFFECCEVKDLGEIPDGCSLDSLFSI